MNPSDPHGNASNGPSGMPAPTDDGPFDLEALAARIRAAGGGPEYWRSLDELAQTEAFAAWAGAEFPEEAQTWTDPVTRRRFLTVMAASLALAGLGGCRPAPRERIMPYVHQPEGI